VTSHFFGQFPIDRPRLIEEFEEASEDVVSHRGATPYPYNQCYGGHSD
jgi:hypothetical protein